MLSEFYKMLGLHSFTDIDYPRHGQTCTNGSFVTYWDTFCVVSGECER